MKITTAAAHRDGGREGAAAEEDVHRGSVNDNGRRCEIDAMHTRAPEGDGMWETEHRNSNNNNNIAAKSTNYTGFFVVFSHVDPLYDHTVHGNV